MVKRGLRKTLTKRYDRSSVAYIVSAGISLVSAANRRVQCKMVGSSYGNSYCLQFCDLNFKLKVLYLADVEFEQEPK